jgi:hypothetical protein
LPGGGYAANVQERLATWWSNPGATGEGTTLGVVTPYVSLLYGHEDYVENSIFLSTVHAVGTASKFRQIWHDAYQQVRLFRDNKQRKDAGQQKRDDLEDLADHLGNLEFDLTFSVEFPLMRIETFQTALYEAMDLSTQAKALSQMFDQLGGSLRSEITAIDVRERRRDEYRAKWNAVSASVLSLIGVAVGFVIAFLGINTTEVPDGKLSMWDGHFAYLYMFAALFALTPTLFIFFPYVRDWALPRTDWRVLKVGLAAILTGAGILAATSLLDHNGPPHILVLDAVLKAVAGILVLAGVVLSALWRGRRLARWLRGRASASDRRPTTPHGDKRDRTTARGR